MSAPEADPVAEGQDEPDVGGRSDDGHSHEGRPSHDGQQGQHLAPEDAAAPGALGMLTAAVRGRRRASITRTADPAPAALTDVAPTTSTEDSPR